MGQTWANRQKAEGSSKLQLALHMFAINKAASSEVETGASGSVKQASRVNRAYKVSSFMHSFTCSFLLRVANTLMFDSLHSELCPFASLFALFACVRAQNCIAHTQRQLAWFKLEQICRQHVDSTFQFLTQIPLHTHRKHTHSLSVRWPDNAININTNPQTILMLTR